MTKSDWPAIRSKIQGIHPVMRAKIKTLEYSLNRATKAAKEHDPECVGLLIDACKLSTALCGDIDHLIKVGIISRDGLEKGIEAYSAIRFHDIFLKFTTGLSREVEAKVMVELTENASGLKQKWLERLTCFAREVSEMEVGRQSSR